MGDSLISWLAKKQPTIARSSTESEYKALANTTAEIMWLRSLLGELDFSPTSCTLWCDNISAIYMTSNPVFHARTKHVELDYHFVREQVASGVISVKYVATAQQIADLFTKPLSLSRYTSLCNLLPLQQPKGLRGAVIRNTPP